MVTSYLFQSLKYIMLYVLAFRAALKGLMLFDFFAFIGKVVFSPWSFQCYLFPFYLKIVYIYLFIMYVCACVHLVQDSCHLWM